MAVTFEFSNAKIYLSKAYTGNSGTSYKAQTWYTAVSDTVTVNRITEAYIALDDGVTYPTRNADATELALLNPGEFNTLNSSGKVIDPSCVKTTVSGINCYLCTSGAYLFFNGNSYPVTQHTTTIDVTGVSLNDGDMTSDNTDVYYGSLSNKATGSGYEFTFETPEGGGDCKIWFCPSGTTTPYEWSWVTDDVGENLPINDDGSITTTLSGDEDTILTLYGSCTYVAPKTYVHVYLDLTQVMYRGAYIDENTGLTVAWHFDSESEVKYKYNGEVIGIEIEEGKYSTIYVQILNADGNACTFSSTFTTSDLYSSTWSVGSNVLTGNLSSSGNSGVNCYGDIGDPSGTASVLNIDNMYATDSKKFTDVYSGAILTYTPESGYNYNTGDDFKLTVVLSGGWKFDTSADCSFGITAGGNPVYSSVTFTDEHTAVGIVTGSYVNPTVFFNDMVGLADAEPEPDYATFITPYIVTKADVNAIADAIWVSTDGSTITAADNILSYKQIFDIVDSDSEQTIKLGNYKLNRTAKYLVDYTKNRNLGSIDIEEFWHNADDYDKTSLRAYIPLVGLVDIDTKTVMGHKLWLEYRYEVIDGKALAVLYTDSYSPSSIIYQGDCNFAIDEPIASNNFSNSSNSYWNVLTNQLGDLQPYLLIDREQPASEVIGEIGNKVQIRKTVKDCSGYTEFEQIFVQDCGATSAEYNELIGLLESGVIV